MLTVPGHLMFFLAQVPDPRRHNVRYSLPQLPGQMAHVLHGNNCGHLCKPAPAPLIRLTGAPGKGAGRPGTVRNFKWPPVRRRFKTSPNHLRHRIKNKYFTICYL